MTRMLALDPIKARLDAVRSSARPFLIGLCATAALVAVDAFHAVALLGHLRAVLLWASLIALNIAAWAVWRKIAGVAATRGLRLLAGSILLNLLLATEVPVLFRVLGRPEAAVDWRPFAYGVLVSCFIAYLRRFRDPSRDQAAAGAISTAGGGRNASIPSPVPGPTGILARAGLRDAAELMAVRAEDHYCRLLLGTGRSLLIAYRFKDAVADLATSDGAQVHRGAWVADHAVTRARRHGRRWSLELANGAIVPVSETSVALCRARGWIGASDGSA